MRRIAFIALLLLAVTLVAGSPPPSGPPAERAPPCSGDGRQDGGRLREAMAAAHLQQVEAILACGAPIAARAPGYRWALAHLIHSQHERLAHLQGYQDWARTTVLRFETPQLRPLPKEWTEQGYTLDSAVLSPNGQYAAARLRDGDGAALVGWWRLTGGEQGLHAAPGYDLAWHGERFAYLLPGQIRIVTVGPQPWHEVVEVPGQPALRHTHWRAGELFYRQGSDAVVMAIADPTGSPKGVAYVVRLGLLDEFDVNMTPFSWLKMSLPHWLTHPWHPENGLLLTVADGTLVYPNAGAVIVEGPAGRFVHILHPTEEPRDPHPVYPIEAQQTALSDDGATLFTAQGALLTAHNYMVGVQQEWRLDGPVVELRHVHGALHAVLPDRVVVIPYR